jgi:hypothetical protein
MCQRRLFAAVALALFAAAGGAGEERARRLLDRSIRAHGGAAALGRFKAVRAKAKGKLRLWGQDVSLTLALALQGSRQRRTEVVLRAGEQTTRQVIVVNGTQGWAKTDDEPAEAREPSRVAEEANTPFLPTAILTDLKSAGVRLTLLPPTTVDGRPAVGLRVRDGKGQRPFRLFFDQESRLLVKARSRQRIRGKEVTQEVSFSHYKDVQGTKQPFHFLATEDGARTMELEFTEIRLCEHLDDRVFAQP